MVGGNRVGRGDMRIMLVIFLFAIFVGSAVVYLRLWTIDSTFSQREREMLRKQFDRASMEAMDESAEWRMKYDAEREKANQYHQDLTKLKDAWASMSTKLEELQKENNDLRREIQNFQRNCTHN